MDDLTQRRKKIIKAALAFGLPLAEAEDAASHAVVKAIENTGIKQPAYYAVIDYLRSQGYRGKNAYFKKHIGIGDHNDESTVALEAANESELFETVSHVFSGLDSQCRTVLILHLVWGLTRNEVAFAMGLTLHNVDAIIRRAKRHLLKSATADNSEI